MKNPQAITVLQDLMMRLQQHELEMSALRKALDDQVLQLTQLQAEVDTLHGPARVDPSGPDQKDAQPSPDEERSQGSRAPARFTDRQEILFSAARGWMWQP
ncbi:MAG: hypothetical protein M3P13_01410 [Acidobacteriota bacterium]|jgi:hypothetical protein|nr:hypothetical protein [Acidobacteriota bacterium]